MTAPDRAAALSDAELARLMTRVQDYADNGMPPVYHHEGGVAHCSQFWRARDQARAILGALRRATLAEAFVVAVSDTFDDVDVQNLSLAAQAALLVWRDAKEIE